MQVLISWGPLGLLFLGALDSAGVPLVGGVDALLITVSIVDPSQAYLAAACAIAGSLLGSVLLFAIARKGGQTLLARYTESRQGARLHRWFERYGLITVFVPAVSPIPMPMKIPVFCAGALEVRWTYFLAVIISARILRYGALAYFGIRYGEQTIPLLKHHWVLVAAVVVVLAAGIILFLRIADQRENRRASDAKAAGIV